MGIRHTRPEPEGSASVTMTLTADVYNGGGGTAEDVVVRFERDGAQAGEATILAIAPGEVAGTSVVWPNLSLGQKFQATDTVDVYVGECDRLNNSLSVPLLVAEHWTHLPLIQRNW